MALIEAIRSAPAISNRGSEEIELSVSRHNHDTIFRPQQWPHRPFKLDGRTSLPDRTEDDFPPWTWVPLGDVANLVLGKIGKDHNE